MIQRLIDYAGRWRPAIVAAVMALSMQATSAATFNPTTSAQLTTDLSQAQLGDTIILQAGYIYEGSFTLPNRTTGSGYITIQSSNLSSLPAAGARVSLSDASDMPRIRPANTSSSVFKTVPSAHHFKLIGLEITGPLADTQPDGITDISYSPIQLGDEGTAQDTLAEVPNNIIIDRCIIRANSSTQRIRRGIFLNSRDTDIINCHISGFKDVDNNDSQAIGGWNGPGPFNIVNNYLEAAAENIIFGGVGATIDNLVPSNIVIKRNYFTKPMTWKGSQWKIKNIFELKNARDVLVEGNIFEHSWTESQVGYAIVFTPRNPNNNNPWATLENITFAKNIVRRAGAGFQILGDDSDHVSQQLNHLTIENNLIYDIGVGDYTGPGILYLVNRPTESVTINHNTAFFSSHVIEAAGVHANFIYTNNITPHNLYGIRSGPYTFGNQTLNNLFPGIVFTHNVLKGGPASSYNQYPQGFSSASVAFPSSWTGVLQNQTTPGTDFAGWKVVANSEYDDGGSDGKDVGCNIDEVVAATAGCISGVWSNPPPSGLIASDSFDYTIPGSLNGNTGGSGFANAWTAVSGKTNPALAAGSLAYSNGANALEIDGHKVKPAANSESIRNFTSAIPTANQTYWVSFRINQTGTGELPATWANFGLWSDLNAGGTDISLGKQNTTTNWGIGHSGTKQQRPNSITVTGDRDAFLVYKLVFTASQATISMWVNPPFSEGSLGTAHATLTKAHTTDIKSIKLSTGSDAVNFQLDEFRFGTTFASVTPTAVFAYEGFDYSVPGSLNGKNGGTGFGSNAWASVGGYASPALASGSMTYASDGDSLPVLGNKLQPALESRSTRNFPSVIPTANQTYWASFRINQTDTGALTAHHAGLQLFSGTNGSGTGIFMGKPWNATNWGIDHSGTIDQVDGTLERNALLLCKLVFTGSQVTVSMWVNPGFDEGSLGTADASVTKAHTTSISSMFVSTGNTASNYQFDEFRFGTSFAAVMPTQ